MNKNDLINKLLKEGKITLEEAFILYENNEKNITFINPPPDQFFVIPDKPMFEIPFPKNLPKTPPHNYSDFVKNCSCNPDNGGSGMCGCTYGHIDF